MRGLDPRILPARKAVSTPGILSDRHSGGSLTIVIALTKFRVQLDLATRSVAFLPSSRGEVLHRPIISLADTTVLKQSDFKAELDRQERIPAYHSRHRLISSTRPLWHATKANSSRTAQISSLSSVSITPPARRSASLNHSTQCLSTVRTSALRGFGPSALKVLQASWMALRAPEVKPSGGKGGEGDHLSNGVSERS